MIDLSNCVKEQEGTSIHLQQEYFIQADQTLSRIHVTTTRPSPTALFEAQLLQAQYNLDKTMLCIVHQVTSNTLDEAYQGIISSKKHKGPMAREPNKYINYLLYSLTSTQAKMPPKGVATGFRQQNCRKHVIFERLCQQSMETTEPSTQALETVDKTRRT
ncbi:hypothetical protein DFH28DRAFT_1111164 [Melampsora americana]|nr:hypothetical protein DFH28DRAFT_1111158 [Melampsora americana]KAH9810295.1 hypothetical protein DFH28DRAFT_1111164 [Melampsora americana]